MLRCRSHEVIGNLHLSGNSLLTTLDKLVQLHEASERIRAVARGTPIKHTLLDQCYQLRRTRPRVQISE